MEILVEAGDYIGFGETHRTGALSEPTDVCCSGAIIKLIVESFRSGAQTRRWQQIRSKGHISRAETEKTLEIRM